LPAAQVIQQGRAERGVILAGQAERGGDGRPEQLRIANPGQVGEDDAVWEPIGRQCGGAQAEPRLTHASGAHDRHHAGGLEQRGDPGELGCPADKTGGLRGQQAKPSRAGDLASADDKGHGYLSGIRDVATITLGRRGRTRIAVEVATFSRVRLGLTGKWANSPRRGRQEGELEVEEGDAMRDAVIVAAVRTPVGKRNGALAGVHPVDLSAHVLNALAERAGLADPADVDDVVWGCVSQVGEQTFDIARNTVLAAGWPQSVPGVTVDRQCGSSQQSVHFAAAGLISGQYDVVVAGGVESMSRVPMGSSLQVAGNPFSAMGWTTRYGEVMPNQGVGAEMMAKRWGLSRTQLDEYSLASHEKAAAAQDAGLFDGQIVPVPAALPGARPLRWTRVSGGAARWLRWAHCVRRSPRTAWSPPAMPARS